MGTGDKRPTSIWTWVGAAIVAAAVIVIVLSAALRH